MKHRDSKLRAQVKWLQEEDYDFLDSDDPYNDFVQYKSANNQVFSSSTNISTVGTNGYRSRRRIDKFEREEDLSFSGGQSHTFYSNASTLNNISGTTSVVKRRRRYTQDVPSRNKSVSIDTGKFAAFLQKWNAHLPILKHFNDAIPSIKYDSVPKLTHYQEDGDMMVDVKFRLKILFNHLTCKLCKGLFFNAYTIKNCLHTFCKSCIITYAILVGQQCPVCHQNINTNLEESIEYDNCIQSMVDKLFPQNNIDDTDADICKRGQDVGVVETEYFAGDGVSGVHVKEEDSALKDDANVSNRYSNYLWDASAEAIEIEKSIYDGSKESQGRISESISNLKACLTLTPLDVNNGMPCYIAVEKEMFISDLGDYLLLKLQIYGRCNVVFYLYNEILPKNHTIEFICKSRRMPMMQCIPLKYSLRYK